MKKILTMIFILSTLGVSAQKTSTVYITRVQTDTLFARLRREILGQFSAQNINFQNLINAQNVTISDVIANLPRPTYVDTVDFTVTSGPLVDTLRIKR